MFKKLLDRARKPLIVLAGVFIGAMAIVGIASIGALLQLRAEKNA